MTRGGSLAWGCWLAVVALSILALWRGLQFRYDLTLFLPEPSRDDQALLFERLGEGPGTRLLTVAISGGAMAERLRVRDAMASRLGEAPVVNRVVTDAGDSAGLTLPEPIWTYRYLLRNPAFETATLQAALEQRVADLSLLGGRQVIELIAADPTFALAETLDRLSPVQASGNDAEWIAPDGAVLLVVETVEPAFAIADQEAAVAAIRAGFVASSPGADLRLEISGPGAFGVELQRTIRAEARWRTAMAGAAVVIVLLIAYRRFRPVLAGALPLVTGGLVGLAGVSLLFEGVHGITLAFGFTLLGVAIDYPLHLFSHARDQSTERAIRSVWPTLALGALSTIIAYLALAVGGSAGLAQLGVFTALGVAAAAGTTRGLLPTLIGESFTRPVWDEAMPPRLQWWPVAALFGGGLAVLAWNESPIWNDNLAALSPVPEQRLVRDAQFREALGSPDMRFAVAVPGATREAALDGAYRTASALRSVDGLGGLFSPTALLPPPAVFERRRQRLPDASTLRKRLAEAAAATPLDAAAFGPFVDAVVSSRELRPLAPEDYRGTPFEQLLGSHLFRSDRGWVSLISLYRPENLDAVREVLPAGANLVDFKATSESLVADYRMRAFTLLASAAGLVGALLWWRFRSKWRTAWVMSVVAAAMVSTTALLLVLFGTLNLYHLIALILVGGLGLDYALFATRPAPASERRDTWHALTACVASTASAFGVLAFSAIPVLQSLGATVVIGCLLAFAAARVGTIGRSSV